MYIVTIDTGTTNTRVKVWKDEKVISVSSNEVGVRDTSITGSKQKLQNAVKAAIQDSLSQADITEDDVSIFLASGMITSNVGLYEVPHALAPAGIKELAQGMKKAVIPEVIDKPIWFVPGIKNNVQDINIENFESMDIMRGEETETFGIIESLKIKGPAIVILPGSHSKFINLSEDNKITGCVTTLAGELLSIITKNTIISGPLESRFSNKANEMMILKGAQYARTVGLNRACFMIRILDQFTGYDTDDKGSFLEGIVFGTDLMAVKNSTALKLKPELPVIIGGSKALKRTFEILVRSDDYFKGEIKVVDDDVMKDMAGFGAILVAKERGLI